MANWRLATSYGWAESILSELFGQSHIADNPCQPGDEPGRFDPPDGLYSCPVASRHARSSRTVE